jgi:hypothetical protein
MGYAPGPYPPAGPQAFGGGPYGVPYSRAEEIRFLKDQAEMIRQDLEAINSRMEELEKEKSTGGET